MAHATQGCEPDRAVGSKTHLPHFILRQAVGFTVVAFVAAIWLIPFYYMLILSFAKQQDTFIVLLVPRSSQWTNYIVAWNKARK